jgi:hypothetical protein
MNRIISVFAGLYVLIVALLLSYQPVLPSYTPIKHDYRVTELLTFMQKHNFAKPYYINDYLQAADQNKFDFRILPVIGLKKSGGCVHLLHNNCFGWNSARTGFGSIPEGISFVTQQLASGKYYAGRTLAQKIRTYNSVNPDYYPSFIKLLNSIK